MTEGSGWPSEETVHHGREAWWQEWEGLFKKQRGECCHPASFPLLNSLWDPSPWTGAAHTQGGITYTQGEAS